MEEPLVSAPQTEVPKRPSMSLAARLMNIFAVPGDVFEELKGSAPLVANWLVPTLVFALVGALSAIIIFSQPAIQQQLREQQAKAMDQKVKAGKITQAQADQAQAMIEKFTGPAMMKVFGSVGAVLVSFWRLFWWALVLFLFSRWFLKAPIGYLKAAEVAGLATMVTVLGALVALLLTVNLARLFAGPSLALVIKDFDATRKSHLVAGAANVFSFWFLGVISAGLAKIAGAPFFKAALPLLAYWVLQETLLIASGLGQFAL